MVEFILGYNIKLTLGQCRQPTRGGRWRTRGTGAITFTLTLLRDDVRNGGITFTCDLFLGDVIEKPIWFMVQDQPHGTRPITSSWSRTKVKVQGHARRPT